MIVVRRVFQAKHGQGGALAQAMKAGVPATLSGPAAPPCWRLLTDLSGPMDTVVLELENLAAWERGRVQLFASPAFQAQVKSSAPLMASGRQEFYTIEAKG